MLKISVITPSFNQAQYIQRSIDSVQSQTGDFELEHIVIDGGSDDGTAEILSSYGDSITYVSEPDEGQADAINKGLAMATGDVVGWLNSDDIYEPGSLETVTKIFNEEPETQWIYGKVRIVDDYDKEIRRWITAYKNWRMRKFSFQKLLAENWISQMGVFWRRQAGEQVGQLRKDLHYCMDYDYWLRLGKKWPGRFVDKYLAAFRWYPLSKSGGGFIEQFSEELDVARNIADGNFGWPVFRHRLNKAKIIFAYWLMQKFRG